jgi:hypothetical protein
MAGLTITGGQRILEHLLGKTAFPMPTIYIALTTTTPTAAAGGTEAAYTGYARKQTVGSDWGAASAASPSISSNAAALSFALCTAGTSVAIGFELWDAASSGSRLAWGSLTAPLAISAGITPAFAIGQLTASAA